MALVSQLWSFALGVFIMLVVELAPRRDPAARTAIDVDDEIAGARLRWYHWRLAALIASAAFFVGYDLLTARFVVSYAIDLWQIGPQQSWLLVSISLIGFVAGALVQGKVSDHAGRRPAILMALWMTAICSLATARWSGLFWYFCGWRLLTGLAHGVLLPACVTYLHEVAPRHARTLLGTCGWGLGVSAGIVTASAVGRYLMPVQGWTVLYLVGAASALPALACYLFLPESPEFLAARGRFKDVLPTLARLRPSNVDHYFAPRAQFVLRKASGRAASVTRLFSPPYRRTTLAISTAAFFVIFAIEGLVAWLPGALAARGETLAGRSSSVAITIGLALFGMLIGSAAVDRLGARRLVLVGWWLLGGAALIVLGFTSGHRPHAGALMLARPGLLGGEGVLIGLTAGWYDTDVRSTAVGVTLGIGCLGALAAPRVIAGLQPRLDGDAGVFAILAAAALVAAVAIAFASARPPVEEADARVTR